jgi:hypothetical protein
MTNDFDLFGDHADPSLDADVALIAAYLARELSTVQIMALQERLATDAAFRATMQQVVDGWVVPGNRAAPLPATRASSLTSDEIEEGWKRHVASGVAGAPALVRQTVTQPARRRSWRENRALRAAAVIAMIVLPVLAIAQLAQFIGGGSGRRAPGSATGASTGEPAGAPPNVTVNEGRPSQTLPLSETSPPPDAQQPGLPAPRPLGAAEAIAPEAGPFRDLVIPFRDGRVMVMDARGLLLLDASLRETRVVLDSAQGKPNSRNCPRFGSGSGGGSGPIPTDLGEAWVGPTPRLTCFAEPFRGDSAQFFDPTTGLFSVIAPDGSVARKYPVPLGYAMFGSPGLWLHPASPTGFIWRSTMTRQARAPRGSTITIPDSADILRMNFDTRRVDTIARIETGGVTGAESSQPWPVFPFEDAVGASSDGSIVIFHARDYRLEWLLPDGKRVAGPKLPERLRVTAEQRTRIVDSINGLWRRRYDSLLAVRAADSARLGHVPTRSVTSTRRGVTTTEDVPVPLPPPPRQISGADVPEYLVHRNERLLVDAEGRAWLPMGSSNSTPPRHTTWLVVSRTGITDRITIPINHFVLGFGPGVIYTLVPETETTPLPVGPYRVQRTKIR